MMSNSVGRFFPLRHSKQVIALFARRSLSCSSNSFSNEQTPTVKAATPTNPAFPDLNTSVDIHEHKLERPKRKGTMARPKPKITQEQKELLRKSVQGSLIPNTLKEMSADEDFQRNRAELKRFGQQALTREERKRRQRALTDMGVPDFNQFWAAKLNKSEIAADGEALQLNQLNQLQHGRTETVQLNIGLYCNQACSHCHVESSPKRTEMMTRRTAEKCVDLLKNGNDVKTVDITGGAPELCDQFRFLVQEISKQGNKTVIDRCNLTALLEPGQEDTGSFLASHGVQIVASLPCYSAKNTNLQRGSGVFQKSVQALLDLNQLGYGRKDSGLKLDLVYNPLDGIGKQIPRRIVVGIRSRVQPALRHDQHAHQEVRRFPVQKERAGAVHGAVGAQPQPGHPGPRDVPIDAERRLRRRRLRLRLQPAAGHADRGKRRRPSSDGVRPVQPVRP